MRRRALAFGVFVVTWPVLLPLAFSEPQHGDERQYVWNAGYYGGLIADGDFRHTAGADRFLDPAWDPNAWWSLTQPMGARFLLAAGIALADAPAPALPYDWDVAGTSVLSGEATLIPPRTLIVARATAILAAALGLALLAWRFRGRGALACGLLLAVPGFRVQFAYAWAEGPLLLGFGLCALAYGSRWLGPALGLAATFKLTAVGLWPLLLLPGAQGRHRGWLFIGPVLTWATWLALEPPAWYSDLGPLYLIRMLYIRAQETPSHVPREAFLLPDHYLWPVALAVFLLAAHGDRGLLALGSHLRSRYGASIHARTAAFKVGSVVALAMAVRMAARSASSWFSVAIRAASS